MKQLPQFGPGQVGAQAEVRAAATETEVRVGRAGDVELSGAVEHRLVAVGRAVEQRHLLAGLDLRAGQFGVDGRMPGEVQHRSGPPDELLCGRPDPRVEIVHQPSALAWIVGERLERVGGGLLGGVVACGGEQHHERADLDVGELVAVDLGVDDVGHQVVVGLATPQLSQLDTGTGQDADLGQRVRRALLEAGVVVIGGAEQAFGRVRHRFLVGGSDADHVRDGPHRELRRAFGDEVDLLAVAQPLDQPVHDVGGVGLNLGLDATNLFRGERRADQPPIQCVLRRIHGQEETRGLLNFGREGVDAHAQRRTEDVRVLTDVLDVGVAGDRPISGLRMGEDRRHRRMPRQPVGGPQLRERTVAGGEVGRPEVRGGDVERVVRPRGERWAFDGHDLLAKGCRKAYRMVDSNCDCRQFQNGRQSWRT